MPLLQAAFFHTGPWLPVNTDTPGHAAMRWQAELSGRDNAPITGVLTTAYSAGWIMQYNIKAAARAGHRQRRPDPGRHPRRGQPADRRGLRGHAARTAGTTALAADQAWRTTSINKVVPGNPDGLETLTGLFRARRRRRTTSARPCYNLGDPFWPEG